MDAAASDVKDLLEPQWAHLGQGKVPTTLARAKALEELATKESHTDAVQRIKEELVTSRQKFAGGR